jgi:hypothetical protein
MLVADPRTVRSKMRSNEDSFHICRDFTEAIDCEIAPEKGVLSIECFLLHRQKKSDNICANLGIGCG